MIKPDILICSLCNLEFQTTEDLDDHVQNSENHPECWRCGKRFLKVEDAPKPPKVGDGPPLMVDVRREFAGCCGIKNGRAMMK